VTATRWALLLAACVAPCGCSGLIGLPEVPQSLTAQEAGLAGLPQWKETARRLSNPVGTEELTSLDDPIDRARLAIAKLSAGQVDEGLALFSAALAERPDDIALGNELRMRVHGQKRAFFEAARAAGNRMPQLPEGLRKEPLATLERIAAQKPSREIRFQIGMAHADTMILYPALEIRAPASVDSVKAFTGILAAEAFYVPALVGRGLNHIHRPRNLVWPEKPAPPPDAGSHDVALAVAAGRKVGGASDRLEAILMMLLGDAYAHEEQVDQAKSWWATAAESTNDPDVREQLRLRASWRDAEVPDRLDAHLAERLADLDHPLTDLSFLWNDRARGPS